MGGKIYQILWNRVETCQPFSIGLVLSAGNLPATSEVDVNLPLDRCTEDEQKNVDDLIYLIQPGHEVIEPYNSSCN
jgi:hypothetical protein